MSDDLSNLFSIPVSSLCCVCRLCAAVIDASFASSIFPPPENPNDLSTKINKYLPISVSESDPFPKTVCKTCVDQLNKFDDLVQKCVVFTDHLRQTLDGSSLDEVDVHAELESEFIKLKNAQDVAYDLEELEFLAHGLSGGLIETLAGPSRVNGAPCQVCRKGLSSFEQCLQHQKAHINDFRCVICNVKNESDVDINIHLGKHFQNLSPVKPKKKRISAEIEKEVIGRCAKCDVEFCDVTAAVDHCEFHRPTDISCYSCVICLAAINVSDLHDHVAKHFQAKSTPLTCDDCRNEYPNEKTLKYHRCEQLKKFKCSLCKQGFKSEARLRFHEEFHENKQTYCELCKKDFKFESRMFLHLAGAHNGERDNPYCCDSCGRTFRWLKTLRLHQETHSKDRPFSCSKCDAKFFSGSALTTHVMCHENTPRLHCMRCDYSTSRKLNLQKHVEKFHKQVDGSQIVVRCRHCHEVFHNAGQATAEGHSHTIPNWNTSTFFEQLIVTKLFQCERCDRSFVSEEELTIHRGTHAKDDRSTFYRCRLCDVGFSRHDLLVRHKKIHQGVTSLYTGRFTVMVVILCDICGIECVEYTQLLNHKERGNCLTKKNNGLHRPKKLMAMPRLRPLKASQLNVNADGLFECLTCNKIYKNRRRYRLHIATHPAPK